MENRREVETRQKTLIAAEYAREIEGILLENCLGAFEARGPHARDAKSSEVLVSEDKPALKTF